MRVLPRTAQTLCKPVPQPNAPQLTAPTHTQAEQNTEETYRQQNGERDREQKSKEERKRQRERQRERERERERERDRERETITHHSRVEHFSVCEGERIADKQGTLGRLQHTCGVSDKRETGSRCTNNICQVQNRAT